MTPPNIRSFLLAALLCLMHSLAFASELRLSYGLGTEESLGIDSTVKGLGAAYIKHWDVVSLKWELGTMSDSKLADPFLPYSTIQFGTQIKPWDWFYVENYFGPGYVSQTTDKLGSNFQFFLDLGLGFKEPNTGAALGWGYQHISNAGIVQPNIGQNVMKIQVGFPLGDK